MSYIINLLEALIVSYGLVELCEIDKKKLFYLINTFITYLIVQYFDLLQQNFLPLSIVCLVIWYLMVCIFVRKRFFYNLFFVIIVNLMCSLCAIIPILFIYQHNVILAGFTAKIIQFIMTYCFISFKRRYSYFEDKYCISIITILALGEMIISKQTEVVVSGNYNIYNVLSIIFMIVIMLLGLYFFHLIDDTNTEIEKMTKKLEKQKYHELRYNYMRSTKDELDRLEHRMNYQMLLVKNEINKEEYENAIGLIDAYSLNIRKANHTVVTGNELFDASMTLKFKDITYDMIPCVTINKNEMYDSVVFINFVVELLETIDVNKLSFYISEENHKTMIKFVSKKINGDDLINVINKYGEYPMEYQLVNKVGVDIFTIYLIMNDENNN